MTADWQRPRGAARAPLYGHDLVRLLYLDEAGSDFKAPFGCVAGVLVHGDGHWPEIDRRIAELIVKYVPPPDQDGFVFHATDVYHGSGYFDRRKPEWDRSEKRHPILCDLAKIIEDLALPIVIGAYERGRFGLGLLSPETTPRGKNDLIQSVGVADCLVWADRWLAEYAPDQLATVVHEDKQESKQAIKQIVRTLRSPTEMAASGLDEATLKKFNLPLRRIIDTVHFAEKQDARPLQLADLCAFTWARLLKQQHVPEAVSKIVTTYMSWMPAMALEFFPELAERLPASP